MFCVRDQAMEIYALPYPLELSGVFLRHVVDGAGLRRDFHRAWILGDAMQGDTGRLNCTASVSADECSAGQPATGTICLFV